MGKLAKRPMTAERFLRRDTHGYEFVDGRVREKTMGASASWVQRRLTHRLSLLADDPQVGFVFESECLYQCFPHKPEQVRKPDASFIRPGRLPGGVIPDGAILIPPDLVAEVVSPNERANDLAAKIADFRKAGVPLIWVVLIPSRTVTVYRDGKFAAELTDADVLTGDPVLPGFRVKVADLFPPLPPAS